jgi:two-component system, OmpR family, sensor histidine kinase KdpD
MPGVWTFDRLRRELRGIALTLIAVAVTTVVIDIIIHEIGYRRGTVIYLIPVLLAATRWGLISALVAAVGGMMASAFFFFPPYYDLRVRDPQEVINLLMYIFVAVVVSQLASRLKWQLELARQREIETRNLYAFMRRLAGAFAVSDIHAAIEDHLATVTQHKVVLFASARDATSAANGRTTNAVVPKPVLAKVVEVASTRSASPPDETVIAENGEVWMVRAVSPKTAEFGMIAINLGHQGESEKSMSELRSRVGTVLADATATLERLDIAHAIGEARMRSQTEQLREALIESVSHELRTPLASILGAATVLSAAPALAKEEKLKALVLDVRNEAERLNNDIQNLLDASRISSNGITPHIEWAEPADIINSAIDRCRRRLTERVIVNDLAADLPLVHVDPVLIQQAMIQIFDNAVKYSPPGSTITVSARASDGQIAISVADQGCGLTEPEQERMWERFERGERHIAITSGSGLGLWIASAFVEANGGAMSAKSAGPGSGTTMTIELPATQAAVPQLETDEDE